MVGVGEGGAGVQAAKGVEGLGGGGAVQEVVLWMGVLRLQGWGRWWGRVLGVGG